MNTRIIAVPSFPTSKVLYERKIGNVSRIQHRECEEIQFNFCIHQASGRDKNELGAFGSLQYAYFRGDTRTLVLDFNLVRPA